MFSTFFFTHKIKRTPRPSQSVRIRRSNSTSNDSKSISEMIYYHEPKNDKTENNNQNNDNNNDNNNNNNSIIESIQQQTNLNVSNIAKGVSRSVSESPGENEDSSIEHLLKIKDESMISTTNGANALPVQLVSNTGNNSTVLFSQQ